MLDPTRAKHNMMYQEAPQSEELLGVEECIPSLRYIQQDGPTYILLTSGYAWNGLECGRIFEQ